MKIKNVILTIALTLFIFTGTSSADTKAEPVKPTVALLSLENINKVLAETLFFDVSFGLFNQKFEDSQGLEQVKKVKVPLVVLTLFFGGLFFTLYFGFINVRAFKHAIQIVSGKYHKQSDTGDLSHFKALTTALSATIGLGNIAGVAIAIQIGGPGAAFWMLVTAFFGMTSKFSECTLAQMFRQKNPDGTISGGPMYYLDLGFKAYLPRFAKLGKVLAVIYAVIISLGALGGGNMFQANQVVEAFKFSFKMPPEYSLHLGILIAFLVALVIVGGVNRIGKITEKIVPAMVIIYVLACLTVLLVNFSKIPEALSTIFNNAFYLNSAFGGIVGVLIIGAQRASFSNEAGLGSASIVHATAKTEEPVREGLVGLLEPFIDTIIICMMTALIVVVTGVWDDPILNEQGRNVGVSLTAAAFATVLPWFPYILTITIFLFAYSTMISWCYYGERGWLYLLNHFGMGQKTLIFYRLIFVFAIIIGAVNSLEHVIDFTDYLFLSLAVPNILGSICLAPLVKKRLKDYMQKYCP